jgi:protein TonB
LKREYPATDVEIGFIINTKGEVLAPYAIKSVNTRFEDAAIRAILKWKFRPGYRGGRPVNTRTQITIKFRVIEDS